MPQPSEKLPEPPARFARSLLTATAAATAAVLLAGCSVLAPPSSSPSGPGTAPEATPDAPAPAPPRTSWGPLASTVEEARAAVAEMTTEQKAGQVLVQFYSGTDPDRAIALAEQLHLGGTIIMGDNVPQNRAGVDTEALAETTGALHEASARDWPSIVGVDQEGGVVARLRAPLTEWPVPMAFGAADDPDLTARAQQALATDLAVLGFTMNFSPDADVTVGPQDPVIGARSYGSDPAMVAEHALAAVDGSLAAGVLPTLKHFPGHGSVTTDSHVGLPVQDASVEEMRERDWMPFLAGVPGGGEGSEGTGAQGTGGEPGGEPGEAPGRLGEETGAPVAMMGHIAVTALDPGVPASLSAEAYDVLRDLAEGIGFEGVAVTDALNMGALADTPGNPAVNALAAGADLLLMPPDVAQAHAAIVAAVADGTVPQERLDEAATRVVALMMWQEDLARGEGEDQGAPASTDAPGSGEAPAAADSTGSDGTESAGSESAGSGSASSGSAASGGAGSEAAPDSQPVAAEIAAEAVTVVDGQCGEPLVGDSIRIVGGNAQDRARLAEAAQAAGLRVGGGDVVTLLGTGAPAASGDVVVTLDAPWPLARSQAGTAKVALFGRTEESFAALVDVLTGAAEAPGALPVDVGEYPAGTGC
ncbi:glycoside hydrolase family 3 N-terminal domain-containing protein [Zhihengliuella sp.]|uniref:glycoside hydrolase family 3 N-terminal domain-containing protein n=1 Tax=Zhihengliuella sp. TaxID=1954483 RepID=UPI0028115C7F|nr:glycoside hydrolase family 3 N-terminal domain-containing protein [Zhihengliuella sp.]